MDIQNVLTPGHIHVCFKHLYHYGVTCMSVMYFVCIYNGIQSDVDQHNTQHGMNGEADDL